MLTKNPPYRSAAFLRFAHELGGGCAFARDGHHDGPIELHHFGEKGMGMKASDLLVARVCRRCHGLVQGKRSFRTFERAGLGEVYHLMLEDSLRLLAAYVEHLERKGKR